MTTAGVQSGSFNTSVDGSGIGGVYPIIDNLAISFFFLRFLGAVNQVAENVG